MPYIVAEINEPDPARSPDMKAGYREIERALARPPAAGRGARRGRSRAETSTGSACFEPRDPVPSVLELQERFGGRRVLITGGGGSIGGRSRRCSPASGPSTSRCWTPTRPR